MVIDIDVQEGKSGDWSVEVFEVSQEDAEFETMRSMFSYSSRMIKAGTYKRLKRNGTVVMSNTPVEISDFQRFVRRATGSVLVNGLGLGVLLKALLGKEEITDITVVEKSEDVIRLVAPYYSDDRLTIINADSFEYKPEKGKRYNAVWHDIWDYICGDNYTEMKTLHRKYGRRCDYQESWCREQCKRNAEK